MASASLACMIPALLNMMSTPPQESRWSTRDLTSVSLETSQTWECLVRYKNRHRQEFTCVSTLWAEGTSWRSFALAFSRAGAEISAMRTLAPSLAKRMHVSRPMPLVPVSSVPGNMAKNNIKMRIQQKLPHNEVVI